MTYLMRWAGSKRRFAEKIAAQFPKSICSYAEPFGGSLSVLLHMIETGQIMPAAKVAVSDVPAVVNLIRCVADKATRAEMLELLNTLETAAADSEDLSRVSTEEAVYRVAKGALFNEGKTAAARAVCVLALNALSFNGLWRVNRRGEFNAPRDKGKHWDPEAVIKRINNVGDLLSAVDLTVCNEPWNPPIWDAACIYIDPPYVDTFSGYAAEGFTDDDHRSLRDLCERLPEGRHVVVSNSDCPKVHDLYSQLRWEKEGLKRPNSITCDGSQRGQVKGEILMVRR